MVSFTPGNNTKLLQFLLYSYIKESGSFSNFKQDTPLLVLSLFLDANKLFPTPHLISFNFSLICSIDKTRFHLHMWQLSMTPQVTSQVTPQVTSLCTTLNFQLRDISRIRKFLNRDTCHLVIRVLVLSKMDYGNALLYGSTHSDLQRLQRIQNWAAKLINCALKKDHATPYLRELHWLPVRERITFKILVYVYKCIHELAPPYLTSLLSLHCPARPGLRSASDITRLFQHNTIRSLQTASNQTFSIAAPQI